LFVTVKFSSQTPAWKYKQHKTWFEMYMLDGHRLIDFFLGIYTSEVDV